MCFLTLRSAPNKTLKEEKERGKRKEREREKNLKSEFRRNKRHLPKASLWSTEAAETANSISNTISILLSFFSTCMQNKKMH